MVVVILGILAATALPRFFDARSDAGNAAIAGVAGGLASATSVNFASKQLGHTVIPATLSDTAANICTKLNVGTALQGPFPSGYDVVEDTGATNTCGADGYVTCKVSSTAAAPAPTSVSFAATCYN